MTSPSPRSKPYHRPREHRSPKLASCSRSARGAASLSTPPTPDAGVRTLTFGPAGQGMITYLILEDQRRVDILDVLWLG